MTSSGPGSSGPGPEREPSPEREGTELARAALARARDRARVAGALPRSRSARARGPVVRGQDWSGAGGDRRDPQALTDVLGRLVDEHGWGPDLSVHAVLGRWDLVVGAELAAHCRVERFEGSRLTLRTDSTAWATQVRLLVPTVLRRLGEEIGEGVVSEVRVLGPDAPSWSRGRRRVPGRGPRDTYG